MMAVVRRARQTDANHDQRAPTRRPSK
jgi:hypothetical protein